MVDDPGRVQSLRPPSAPVLPRRARPRRYGRRLVSRLSGTRRLGTAVVAVAAMSIVGWVRRRRRALDRRRGRGRQRAIAASGLFGTADVSFNGVTTSVSGVTCSTEGGVTVSPIVADTFTLTIGGSARAWDVGVTQPGDPEMVWTAIEPTVDVDGDAVAGSAQMQPRRRPHDHSRGRLRRRLLTSLPATKRNEVWRQHVHIRGAQVRLPQRLSGREVWRQGVHIAVLRSDFLDCDSRGARSGVSAFTSGCSGQTSSARVSRAPRSRRCCRPTGRRTRRRSSGGARPVRRR